MSALVRQLPWHFRALSMSVLANQSTPPLKIQSRKSCSSIPPYSLGYKKVTCPPRFKWTRTRVFLLMEDRQNSRNMSWKGSIVSAFLKNEGCLYVKDTSTVAAKVLFSSSPNLPNIWWYHQPCSCFCKDPKVLDRWVAFLFLS